MKKDHRTNLEKFRIENVPTDQYIQAITAIPRPSHDLFPLVETYNKKGILLIERKNEPAKGMIWPIGGRQQRGYYLRDSLINLVKEECGLKIYDISCLCGEPEDLFWEKDSFGHGKGVHDVCVPYFARTRGNLKLDLNHENPLIITPKEFSNIKDDLHWYVQKYTEKALKIAFD